MASYRCAVGCRAFLRLWPFMHLIASPAFIRPSFGIDFSRMEAKSFMLVHFACSLRI